MGAMVFNRLHSSQLKRHDKKHCQKLSMRLDQTTHVTTYAFHMLAMVLKWFSMVFQWFSKNVQWSSHDFQWFSKLLQWLSTGCLLVNKKHDRKHHQKLSMRRSQTTNVKIYALHMFAMVSVFACQSKMKFGECLSIEWKISLRLHRINKNQNSFEF